MFRRLRNFAWLIPIVLLILVALLWARSYLPEETYFRSHHGRLLIFFVSGNFEFGNQTAIDYSRRVAQVQNLPSLNFAGFEWTDLNFKSSYPGFIAVPYWFITSILAAISLWAILRRRSQRERSLPGHCRVCGYDLRGSHGKCPECGHDPALPADTTSAAAIE